MLELATLRYSFIVAPFEIPVHGWCGVQIQIRFWKSERNLVKKSHCVPHITPPGTKSPINLLSQTHRQKSSESLEMHCKSWRKQSNAILFQILFWFTVRKKLFLWSRRTFEFQCLRPRIYKNFEITKTIYLNSEMSVQFLKQNAFWTCSWMFLRPIRIQLGIRNIQKKLERIRILPRYLSDLTYQLKNPSTNL